MCVWTSHPCCLNISTTHRHPRVTDTRGSQTRHYCSLSPIKRPVHGLILFSIARWVQPSLRPYFFLFALPTHYYTINTIVPKNKNENTAHGKIRTSALHTCSLHSYLHDHRTAGVIMCNAAPPIWQAIHRMR